MKKLGLLNWLLVWSLAPLGGAWGAFVLTPESAELENVTVPVREAFALLESGDVAAGVAGFLKAAESGDKDGQFAMGYVTAEGTGVERSREGAMAWYEKAALQGHVAAQVNLAALLLQDEPGYKDGVSWLKRAAGAGSNRARAVIARAYVEGSYGLGKDWGEAEAMLLALHADTEDEAEKAGAGMQLVRLYEGETEGWDAQPEKAVEWLNRLVDADVGAAKVRLGDKFFSGDGVEKSAAKAKALYAAAGEEGEPTGHLRLAAVAEAGKRWDEMVKHLEAAAEGGNGDSYTTLGQVFEKGQGVDADLKRAAAYYEKGAEAGVVICMHNLGVMYDNGRGVDEAPEVAARWFFEAAGRGLLESQNQLAAYYRQGRGVMRDPVAAAAWFDRAARAGHALAQVNLASMFEAGEGVRADPSSAARLYQQAAQRGMPLAMARLGVMLVKGSGLEANHGKAHALLVRAGELGVEGAADEATKLEPGLSAGERGESTALLKQLRGSGGTEGGAGAGQEGSDD